MWQKLVLSDADVCLCDAWWPMDRADAYFTQLQSDVVWQQKAIHLFGREVMQPRLVAWHGDEGADYRYSGVLNQAMPWTPLLKQMVDELNSRLSQRFNAVLCNFYRNGHDSVGWHSDDEPELGAEPVIASLSLGATRFFDLQHKKQTEQRCRLSLAHNSLLLMQGTTQRYYRHRVPKDRHCMAARINLTFRYVQPVLG